MSCKSAIYTANTTAATVTLTAAQPSATLNLGTTIRRFGQGIQLSGSGITVDERGYYDVDSSVTLTTPTAGTYTIELFEDGAAVPGAKQSETTVADDVVSFNIPALVRLQCCSSAKNLSLVVTTTAALPVTLTVNNVGVVVEKL